MISDQIGAPTFTAPLATARTSLVERRPPGVWHVTGSGSASWYDLAMAAIEGARQRGAELQVEEMEPISSAQWAAAADRPPYSVLDTSATEELLGHGLPPWRESLDAWLDRWKQGEHV